MDVFGTVNAGNTRGPRFFVAVGSCSCACNALQETAAPSPIIQQDRPSGISNLAEAAILAFLFDILPPDMKKCIRKSTKG